MVITKVSSTHFHNGFKELETKSFLKHDLVHFAVDKALGIYNEKDPMLHSLEVEQLAGVLHNVYDEGVSNARILEGARNLFSAHQKETPLYLKEEFIDIVRVQARILLRRYELLKTGESMELA